MYDEKDSQYLIDVLYAMAEKFLSLKNFYQAEKYFDLNDDKQTWFDKLKDLAEEFGYAREVKEFKANPDKYEAHVGDVSTLIRIAVTGRTNTPDLYEIMKVLGKDVVLSRLKNFK